jgi:hypothetical protein
MVRLPLMLVRNPSTDFLRIIYVPPRQDLQSSDKTEMQPNLLGWRLHDFRLSGARK